jgi:hypothetical protein
MRRNGVLGAGWAARAAASVGIAAVSLGCGSKAPENVDAVVAPLELNFLNFSEASVAGKGVNLVTTASEKGASPLAKDNVGMTVEAIRYDRNNPYSDGTVTSCGATFVSPHFAITAAHCVGPQRGFQPTPTGPRTGNFPGTPGSCPSGSCAPGTYNDHANFFRVEHYNTTNLNINFIPYLVQGTWTSGSPTPTQTYSIKSATITAAQGYVIDDNTRCSVYAQCEQDTWGRNDKCPLTSEDADIALIYCPSRQLRNYARVASADGFHVGLEVWWFHELLYLQIPGTGLAPYMPAGNVDHYGFRNTELDNYHYFQLNQPIFQLFPLVSKWDASQNLYVDSGTHKPAGTPSWQSEVTEAGVQVEQINTPICHGTSGSGAFQVDSAGNHFLLGPMDISGSNFDHGQATGTPTNTLCDFISDPGNTASMFRSAYVQLKYTQALANMSVVSTDRAGTVPNP